MMAVLRLTEMVLALASPGLGFALVAAIAGRVL